MKRLCAALLASLLFVTACDVFVPAADMNMLREREKKIYVLKTDLENDGKKLKKGDDIRIKITTGSDWVKVHAYPARTDELKAEYLLLLFVFDDDFETGKYDAAYFTKRLNAVAAERGAAPVNK